MQGTEIIKTNKENLAKYKTSKSSNLVCSKTVEDSPKGTNLYCQETQVKQGTQVRQSRQVR